MPKRVTDAFRPIRAVSRARVARFRAESVGFEPTRTVPSPGRFQGACTSPLCELSSATPGWPRPTIAGSPGRLDRISRDRRPPDGHDDGLLLGLPAVVDAAT